MARRIKLPNGKIVGGIPVKETPPDPIIKVNVADAAEDAAAQFFNSLFAANEVSEDTISYLDDLRYIPAASAMRTVTFSPRRSTLMDRLSRITRNDPLTREEEVELRENIPTSDMSETWDSIFGVAENETPEPEPTLTADDFEEFMDDDEED